MTEPNSIDQCQSIWSAMECGRALTLDDLKVISGVLEKTACDYLQELIKRDYVWMNGIRRAASGEALPSFKLVKRTGPEAPHLDGKANFIDPNLEKQRKAAPKKIGQGQVPSIRARYRVLAKRLDTFTRDQFKQEMGAGPEFTKTWNHLRFLKEFRQIPGIDLYQFVPSLDCDRVWAYFQANLGKPISASELRNHLQQYVSAGLIQQVLDISAAEGFQIEVIPRAGGRKTQYRVTKLENGGADAAN
jgi:hypothetical protein